MKIPKLRKGSYFPAFLEPRKTAERALAAVVQEAWIQGVSTRKVDDLVKAMGMDGVSKSQVSALCKDIDQRVASFLNRPIAGDWPYVWLDATYLKVREDGRIVSVAAIIVTGVNAEGRREILGLEIGASEAATFWLGFLRSLEKRGDCQESCVRDRVAHHALTNLSSNMMANWVFASHHSRGGIFHVCATWRKTRNSNLIAASSVGK